MAFNLRKNNHKDTTNIIQYDYYKTPFYKNQYEKTVQNGGYVKIPYSSQSNKPNLLLDGEYTTKNIIISKKIHTIDEVDFDGELIIEHTSSTNTKPLYTCILLKTANVFDTPIDHMIQAKRDFTLDLNDLLLMSDCMQCIWYESKMPVESTRIIVFTQPILVTSKFDAFTKVSLFSPHNNVYSLVRIQPILGNIVKEGFKEGLDVTTKVGYCQLIDENDPSIGSEAQVIVPIKADTAISDTANNTIKMVLYIFAFFSIFASVYLGIPYIYDILFVRLVVANTTLTSQQKLNRMSAINAYTSVFLFFLALTFINNGITNNIELHSVLGLFIIMFLIACFLFLYAYHHSAEEGRKKFLEKFNNPLVGEPASFDKVQNDLGGLFIDNTTGLVWNTSVEPKTGQKKFTFSSAIFVLLGIFFFAYGFVKFSGIINAPGTSIFLSFPFYIFLLSIYLTMLFKYSMEQRLIGVQENR